MGRWRGKERRGETYRSCETVLNSDLFSGFVWMRRLAVRTNWPTVALKPARKALKGYWFLDQFRAFCLEEMGEWRLEGEE